jgi:hypothetical protein
MDKLGFMDDESTAEVGSKIEDLLTELQQLGADPDLISFLFISTGQMLLISNNHDDPAFVTYLNATALVSAAASAAANLQTGRVEH